MNLRNVGRYLRHNYGRFDQVGNDYYTEVFDLYKPLYQRVKHKEKIWFGLNLIRPTDAAIELPNDPDIDCYILTFHGDPVDNSWIDSQVKRLTELRPDFDLNRIIVVTDHSREFSKTLRYFHLEHLHQLPLLYGKQDQYLMRPPEQRSHTWSLLSGRPTWQRAALMSAMLYFKDGILISARDDFDWKDERLLNACAALGVEKNLEDLKNFLPSPLDENEVSTEHSWSTNNIAYQDVICNIVNESTMFSDDHREYLSEKSFKPFIGGCLPIVDSFSRSDRLRDFGFEVEETIYQPYANAIKIQTQALTTIMHWSSPKQILKDIQEHNRNWFFDGFRRRMIARNEILIEELIDYVNNIVG